MNNRKLADAFAAGATTGTGSHMFIYGDAIYSYGRHFMIARRTPRGFLVTSRGYSPSTARHISYVKAAIKWEYIEAADLGHGHCDALEFPKAKELRARIAATAKAEERRARLDALREAREAKKAANAPPRWAVEAVPAVEEVA